MCLSLFFSLLSFSICKHTNTIKTSGSNTMQGCDVLDRDLQSLTRHTIIYMYWPVAPPILPTGQGPRAKPLRNLRDQFSDSRPRTDRVDLGTSDAVGESLTRHMFVYTYWSVAPSALAHRPRAYSKTVEETSENSSATQGLELTASSSATQGLELNASGGNPRGLETSLKIL